MHVHAYIIYNICICICIYIYVCIHGNHTMTVPSCLDDRPHGAFAGTRWTTAAPLFGSTPTPAGSTRLASKFFGAMAGAQLRLQSVREGCAPIRNHTYVYLRVYARVIQHTQICTDAYLFVHIPYMYMHVYMYIHTYISTYICMYIHIYISIIHVRVCSESSHVPILIRPAR